MAGLYIPSRAVLVWLLFVGVVSDALTSFLWFARWWGRAETPLDSNPIILWISHWAGAFAPLAYFPFEAFLFVVLPWLTIRHGGQRSVVPLFWLIWAALLYGAIIHNLLVWA